MLYVKGTAIGLTRGDTAFLAVPIENVDTGKAYALAAGDELVFTVKSNAYADKVLFQKKLSGDNTFEIKPEDTATLDFGHYVYDVQITTEIGHVFTVIEPSDFEVLEEVT